MRIRTSSVALIPWVSFAAVACGGAPKAETSGTSISPPAPKPTPSASVAPPPDTSHAATEPPVALALPVRSDVDTSRGRGCMVLTSGRVACWGETPQGIFGTPTLMKGIEDAYSVDSATPTRLYVLHRNGSVSFLDAGAETTSKIASLTDVKKLESGGYGVCALRSKGTIDCWSFWGEPQPEQVARFQDAVDFAAGGAHLCIVTKNFNVQCQGRGNPAPLGQGPELKGNDLLVTVPGISDAIAVSAASAFSCALRKTGQVLCWGADQEHNLGRGESETGRPVDGTIYKVAIENVLAIRSRDYLTCALQAGGAASCWGANYDGQLGDGTSETRFGPVRVKGLSAITAITPGDASCAITQDDKLACWGNVVRHLPVQVKDLKDATNVSAGGKHTCAIRKAGDIVCWGEREIEKSSTISLHNALVPTPIGISGATQVVTGKEPSRLHDGCAIVQGGAVKCWNPKGQTTPGINDATSIALGQYHGCVLRRGGKVACWGNNNNGQLGTSGEGPERSAKEVPGVSSAIALSAGGDSTCVINKGGSVVCWGNKYGSRPREVSGISDAVQIALGYTHACARRKSGRVACWGSNSAGVVSGTTNDLETPSPIDSTFTDVVDVSASMLMTCVVRASGHVSCWGNVGKSETRGGSVAVKDQYIYEVVGVTDAAFVSVGADHACVTTKQGTVLCWGNNENGQIGDGSGPGVPTFMPVPSP